MAVEMADRPAWTPGRRARQAAIMRERWATRRDEMLTAVRGGAATREHHPGWARYHARAGHDGGYSAALADGAWDHEYRAVRTLDYWEALHEPPWDIGWDRACLPATPSWRQHTALHRWQTDRCEVRQEDGTWRPVTVEYRWYSACEACQQRLRPAETRVHSPRVTPSPSPVRPLAPLRGEWACGSCPYRQPTLLWPGRYHAQCPQCGYAEDFEVSA